MKIKTKSFTLIAGFLLLIALTVVFSFLVYKIIQFKIGKGDRAGKVEVKKIALNEESVSEHQAGKKREEPEARIYPVERNLDEIKNVAGAADDGTIAIKVKDNAGIPIEGLKCQLSIVKKNPEIITSSLKIDESDNNGECVFYELKPNVRYWVEIYNEINRTYRQFAEINDISPGGRIEKEITIFPDELGSAGGFGSALNQSRFPCDDSDDGINYVVRGEISGVSRCIIDNLIQDCPDGIKSLNDTCVQGEYDSKKFGKNPELIEYFCDSDGRINMKGYLCPKGCSNGACKKM
jgi:hypothetical protein